MFNRVTYFFGVSCLCIIVSCGGNPSHNNAAQSDNSTSINNSLEPLEKIIPKPKYHVENNVVTISFSDSTISNMVRYSYLPEQEKEISTRGNVSLDFDEIIRSDSENVFEIAYLLLTNKGSLTVSLESNDSSYSFPYTYQNAENSGGLFVSCNSPFILPLSKKGEVKYSETQIKKWLYTNNLQLSPSDINKMKEIADGLHPSSNGVLVGWPDKDMKILKDLKGQRFNVKSNAKADYYYLFASNNYKEIDDFIADVVSIDYKNSASTLSTPLLCYRGKYSSGLLCVFLIALNKDWSKNILPIGLIFVDQMAPSIVNNGMQKMTKEAFIQNMMTPKSNSNSEQDSNRRIPRYSDYFSYMLFDELGIKIETPKSFNLGTGSLTVSNGHFVGNTVNFNLEFLGDVHKMVVELGQTKKELILSDKTSPYTYNCWLPLNIGDNYILITVYDKLGNYSSTMYYIEMVRIKDDPGIYIDNEINIYND